MNRHGVGCAEHTCGNPRLQKYVMDEARRVGIPVPAIDGFQRAMEQATGTQVEPAAEDASNFAKQNDAQMAENLSKVPAMSRVARQLEGYVMEQRENNQSRPNTSSNLARPELQVLFAGIPIIALLVLWRRRRLRGGR